VGSGGFTGRGDAKSEKQGKAKTGKARQGRARARVLAMLVRTLVSGGLSISVSAWSFGHDHLVRLTERARWAPSLFPPLQKGLNRSELSLIRPINSSTTVRHALAALSMAKHASSNVHRRFAMQRVYGALLQ